MAQRRLALARGSLLQQHASCCARLRPKAPQQLQHHQQGHLELLLVVVWLARYRLTQ